MHDGSIAALYRWPVKSFGGERVAAAVVGRCGVGGDRAHAVVDGPSGRPLSARAVPRLLAWSATYADEPSDADDPPWPELISPAGVRFDWSDPALLASLVEDLGRPALELRRQPRGQHDDPGTIFVTTEVTRTAVEDALGGAVDIRRFRTNLHLEIDGPPFMEERWEGARLTVDGGPTVQLGQPCDRCSITTHDPDRPAERRREVLTWLQLRRGALFGIRGRVEAPGRVVEGSQVAVTLDS